MLKISTLFSNAIRGYLRAALISVLFILGACTPDYGNLLTSPKDLPPSIFAFLNTAADSQYVILRSAIPPAEIYDDFTAAEFERLRQARVTLTNGAGHELGIHNQYVMHHPQYDDEPDFFFVSARRIQPGESFQLRVEIPQKGVYTASTTAPGDFQILAPNALDTIAVFDSLHVQWTAANEAAGYRLILRWFILDSADFKAGKSAEIETWWGHRYWYFKHSPSPNARIKVNFERYYLFPEEYEDLTILPEAELTIEALDSPAWLAREINARNGTVLTFEALARLMPGAYSNITNGRGLMTATTSLTITLLLPPRR